jgi:hypothetical protein
VTDNWQPFVGAPRDGTIVLVAATYRNDVRGVHNGMQAVQPAYFHPGRSDLAGWHWACGYKIETEWTPTHWMPLPAPPH